MQCFRCLHKGHPASHFKDTIGNANSYKQKDNDKSKPSKSSKSRNTNKAASIMNLRNSQIKMKKVFTTLNTIIKDMDNEDSYLTNSDEDDKEKFHFQFE